MKPKKASIAAAGLKTKSGRIVRKSIANPDYVDPTKVVEYSSGDDDGDSDSDCSLKNRPKKKRRLSLRRRRSTPPRSLSPSPDRDPEELNSDSSDADSEASAQSDNAHAKDMSLTFHIPPGQQGPFVVKLQLNTSIPGNGSRFGLQLAEPDGYMDSHEVGSASGTLDDSRSDASTDEEPKIGFLDLPAEIRNDIYRYILVDKRPINIAYPSNFGHSGALLATNRQIQNEAADILYGENTFHFERQSKPRGHWWEPDWAEVGYKDCRRFLSTIGPHNVARIKTVGIRMLDSASPDARRRLTDDHRFINDQNLIEVLRLLAQSRNLREISLQCNGRKRLRYEDKAFLRKLYKIKVDELRWIEFPYRNHVWYSGRSPSSNMDSGLDKEIAKHMVRKQPKFLKTKAAEKDKREDKDLWPRY